MVPEPTTNLENFSAVVQKIESNLNGPWRRSALNEAAVRQVIVLRLLFAAGFDIWNPDEIAPVSFNSGRGQSDFEVRINRKTCFLLKIKSMDSSMTERDVSNATSHAYNKTVRWVISTNGRTWMVFDTYLYDRDMNQRMVMRIDLPRKHGIEDFSRKLYGILNITIWKKDKIQERLQTMPEYVVSEPK